MDLSYIGVLEDEAEAEIPFPIQRVLTQFQRIFYSPTGLPPRRSHDRAIILHLGTSPINVRPHHCPQVQKAKIECMVKEMLAMGIIQPSTNPFSSPVLLVKKKKREDGDFALITGF